MVTPTGIDGSSDRSPVPIIIQYVQDKTDTHTDGTRKCNTYL